VNGNTEAERGDIRNHRKIPPDRLFDLTRDHPLASPAKRVSHQEWKMRIFTANFEKLNTDRRLHCVWVAGEGQNARLMARWVVLQSEPKEREEKETSLEQEAVPLWPTHLLAA
jgi:hypothetical protein